MRFEEYFSLGGEDQIISIRFTVKEANDISDWMTEHHYDSQQVLHELVMNAVAS